MNYESRVMLWSLALFCAVFALFVTAALKPGSVAAVAIVEEPSGMPLQRP